MKDENHDLKQIFLIVLAGALLIILIAVFINFQRTGKFFNIRRSSDRGEMTKQQPISESDDVKDIDEELKDTDVGSFDDDIESLEIDAVTL